MEQFEYQGPGMTYPARPKVCVVGGAGRVGLPLALSLAHMGRDVVICDTSQERLNLLRDGRMPFEEAGCQSLLLNVQMAGTLKLTDQASAVADCGVVILCLPTDKDTSTANMKVMFDVVGQLAPHLSAKHVLLIRSTCPPGGVHDFMTRLKRALPEGVSLPAFAYMPERLVQGVALDELQRLPQLIAGDSYAIKIAQGLLHTVEFVGLPMLECELAKLMTNAYRYGVFGLVNELYVAATAHGADWPKLVRAMKYGYPRMESMPVAGFAGGPCLMKDAAALINWDPDHLPGLAGLNSTNLAMPGEIFNMVRKRFPDASNAKVGLLGMTFKGGNDDLRGSHSITLRDFLVNAGYQVLCHDVYHQFQCPPLMEIVKNADILVIGAAHKEYRKIITAKPVIDPFGCLGKE